MYSAVAQVWFELSVNAEKIYAESCALMQTPRSFKFCAIL